MLCADAVFAVSILDDWKWTWSLCLSLIMVLAVQGRPAGWQVQRLSSWSCGPLLFSALLWRKPRSLFIPQASTCAFHKRRSRQARPRGTKMQLHVMAAAGRFTSSAADTYLTSRAHAITIAAATILTDSFAPDTTYP